MIHHRRGYFHRALFVDGHEDIALATTGAPFREGKTPANVLRLRLEIPGQLDRLFQRLHASDMRNVTADGCLITIVQHVLTFELRRVHVELTRHHVHLAFVSKKSLRIAGRPHVPARHLVRIDEPFFNETIEDFVGSSAGLGADQIPRWLHRSVSAAVEQKVHVVGHDKTVLLHARFNFDD